MSAFDKIAKKSETPSSKKTSVVAAVVTKTIAKAVDEFVIINTTIKSAEADKKVLETQIIDYLRQQQDKLAYAGQFTKSMSAAGLDEKSRVTFVTTDRFTIPQDDTSLIEIKRVTGAAYEDMFETKRSITMKKEVLENETLLNKIAAVCDKAGMALSEVFEVGDKVVARSGLDEKQYNLSSEKLDIFRTLVKQYKPALK
jgi:hypothetical protein